MTTDRRSGARSGALTTYFRKIVLPQEQQNVIDYIEYLGMSRQPTWREKDERYSIRLLYKPFSEFNLYRCDPLLDKSGKHIGCDMADECSKASTQEANLRYMASQVGNGEIQDHKHLAWLFKVANNAKRWKEYLQKENCTTTDVVLNDDIFDYSTYREYSEENRLKLKLLKSYRALKRKKSPIKEQPPPKKTKKTKEEEILKMKLLLAKKKLLLAQAKSKAAKQH